jgi:hypothetical protein
MEAFSRFFPKKGRLSPEKGFFSALREEIARYFLPILPAGRAEIHLSRISLKKFRGVSSFAILKYGILSGTEMVSPVRKFASLGFSGSAGVFPGFAI